LLSFEKSAIIWKKKNVAITPEKQLLNMEDNQAEQAGDFVVKENKESAESKKETLSPKKENQSKPETEKKPFFKKPRIVSVAVPKLRDATTVRVEKIMEEGLREAYEKMSPIAKQEFKIKGEETAEKIGQLLKKTHVKVRKIFTLIFEWLKMIPGVNYFFLEQEAKIKADRILALKNHQKE